MFNYTFKLLKIIAIQQKIIVALMIFALGKKFEYSSSKSDKKPIDKKYRKMPIDDMPTIKKNKKLDYTKLIAKHEIEKSRPLEPIQRQTKCSIPKHLKCPICGAPRPYIYDNNGGKGQYQCKVCKTNFNYKNYYSKSVVFKCPHCGKTLERIKDRKKFFIHKCRNKECSYYLKRFSSMTSKEKKRYKNHPEDFKLHYIFREFKFDFKSIQKNCKNPNPGDLARIHATPYTLGLVLSYHINFGISARKTADLIKEIHGISISGQSVLNYAKLVATNVKPLVENYPYELSDSVCGDETYIKVLGKWRYIFFFFDAEKKIILSHYTSPNRDTKSACTALNYVFSKYQEIPEDFQVIVDGNPIYLLARLFFKQHGIDFDVKQVIGLTNNDKISTEYRALKQIIERLNRTFKKNYHRTNGYNSDTGALTAVTLFTAYFNFLRPHSSLEDKTPVVIPELKNLPNMPARWCKLIEMSQNFIEDHQAA